MFYSERAETRQRRHTQRLAALDFNLGICPARNLNDHVDDVLFASVGVDGDVVPERGRVAIFLKPYSPILNRRKKFVRTFLVWKLQSLLAWCTNQSIASADFAQSQGASIELLRASLCRNCANGERNKSQYRFHFFPSILLFLFFGQVKRGKETEHEDLQNRN